MLNQILINYIVEQLDKGFKAEQIFQHLINNRYSLQDVNDAMAVAQKSAVNSHATQPNLQSRQTGTVQTQTTYQPQLHSQPSQQTFQPQLPTADQRLVSYITQQRNSGFDQNSIRNYLLKYGYAVQQIDPAVDTVFHPVAASTGKHITHLGAIIVSVIVLVSVFSGAGLFFFFQFSQDNNIKDQLMDYTVKATKTSLLPGDTLSFEISMDNKGNDKRYDVELTHKILDVDQKEIDSVQETVAVETTTEQVTEIKVPENLKPGKYKLVSVGKYGEDESQEVSASFSFEVKGADFSKGDDTEKQPKVDQPKKVDSSKKTDTKPQSATQQPKKTQPASPASQPSTQPSTDDKIPAKDAKAQPDEDEQKVSIDEIEADVRTKAADPGKISEADALCQTLTTQNEKDYCYSDIAEVSKQKQYCDKINHQYRRDVCYLNNFMEKGDYSVCDVIIDYELNLACKEQAKRTVTLTPFPQPLTQITTTISPLGSDSTTSSDVPASGSATTSDSANTPSDGANNTNELTNAQNTTQANEESQN